MPQAGELLKSSALPFARLPNPQMHQRLVLFMRIARQQLLMGEFLQGMTHAAQCMKPRRVHPPITSFTLFCPHQSLKRMTGGFFGHFSFDHPANFGRPTGQDGRINDQNPDRIVDGQAVAGRAQALMTLSILRLTLFVPRL